MPDIATDLASVFENRDAHRRLRLERSPAMRVQCPHCGAQPGDDCTSKGADFVAILHKARREAAESDRRSWDAAASKGTER